MNRLVFYSRRILISHDDTWIFECVKCKSRLEVKLCNFVSKSFVHSIDNIYFLNFVPSKAVCCIS